MIRTSHGQEKDWPELQNPPCQNIIMSKYIVMHAIYVMNRTLYSMQNKTQNSREFLSLRGRRRRGGKTSALLLALSSHAFYGLPRRLGVSNRIGYQMISPHPKQTHHGFPLELFNIKHTDTSAKAAKIL